jgi:hypothetical protein
MDWKCRRTAIPVVLMAGLLMPSAGAANIDCAEVLCQSVEREKALKSMLKAPIEPYNDIATTGANRAHESEPEVHMACCYERPGKASETYPQRLDDVLLAFFFWLSVIASWLGLAVFVVLGVNVYTLTKGTARPQRTPVVSFPVLRDTRNLIR